MRITFVLPAPIRIPMGGPKVVYAHAQGLVKRGHEVVVVAPSQLGGGMRGRAMSVAMHLRDRFHSVSKSPYYHAADAHTLLVPTVSDRHLPDADIVIATGVQTAAWVRDLAPSKGAKAYFLQHVETFIDPKAIDTWHYPLAKITIARWIKDRIEAEGESVLGIVPNAIDPKEFYIEEPIESRPNRVISLYHRQPIKGPDVLIQALHIMKQALPELEADVFAARPPSHRLPDFVNIHIRPELSELRRLYNRSAVSLHASKSEGSPLVPMEAAACGCAIVASANEGVQQYLDNGKTMRMTGLGDGPGLAHAALDLLQNPDERIRLAHAAMEEIANYNWADSTAHFESLLRKLL